MHVLCTMHTIKAASVPEKYILRRYTKHPKIQPTFNRNDLRIVASNKASQYCIEISLLMLNMRVHRKILRSQEKMARSWVVLDKLEQELDAMHSAENGGVADNEAIEQDIATMLSEMNHLGAVDPFDNEEEEQQQLELAHVHTQEQQHAHMHDHELDGAVGERHDNKTSIFSNTKGRKSKMQAAKATAKKLPRPIKRVEFRPDGKPLGIRTCGFCNVVTNHNYHTCPLRTDAIVNKQKLQKQIGAAQVSTNGDDTRNSYTCRKCGGTGEHNARTSKVGMEVSGADQK